MQMCLFLRLRPSKSRVAFDFSPCFYQIMVNILRHYSKWSELFNGLSKSVKGSGRRKFCQWIKWPICQKNLLKSKGCIENSMVSNLMCFLFLWPKLLFVLECMSLAPVNLNKFFTPPYRIIKVLWLCTNLLKCLYSSIIHGTKKALSWRVLLNEWASWNVDL